MEDTSENSERVDIFGGRRSKSAIGERGCRLEGPKAMQAPGVEAVSPDASLATEAKGGGDAVLHNFCRCQEMRRMRIGARFNGGMIYLFEATEGFVRVEESRLSRVS